MGSTVVVDSGKNLPVEVRVFEEDGCAGTQDILLVGQEKIWLFITKATQAIVIHHSFPQYH